MTEAPRPRCAVCGARDWRGAAPWTCGHCGLRVAPDHDPGAVRTALDAMLRPGPVDAGKGDRPFALDMFTLRVAASRAGLAAEPLDREDAAALAYPHSARPARARLAPRAPAPPRVALGMILRAGALERALERMAPWRAAFPEIVLVEDGAPSPEREEEGARVLRRPLERFDERRNAAQRAARSPWVLQLDDDETPSPALVAAVHALAAMADRHNLVSVGFARRNLVDGAPSDLWPDVQYRLNRREVRFRGAVHERPDAPGGWRRTTLALDGPIDHHLDRARVEERSRAYEAMAPGGGRPADERALLRPFRP